LTEQGVFNDITGFEGDFFSQVRPFLVPRLIIKADAQCVRQTPPQNPSSSPRENPIAPAVAKGQLAADANLASSITLTHES
jgi:hypothetical protein